MKLIATVASAILIALALATAAPANVRDGAHYALVTAITLSTGTPAHAQTAAPAAPAAQTCKVGIGVSLYIPFAAFSDDDFNHPDQVKLSADKPLKIKDVFANGGAANATTVLPGSSQTIAEPMKPGDIITAVDGKSVYGKTLKQVVAEIDNGPAGSHVVIHIERDGGQIGRDLTIERGNFCASVPNAPMQK